MQLNFDARSVAPNTMPEPVETGEYPAIITSVEEKPNSQKTGSFVELILTIQGGQYNGRTIKDRLNLKNPNQQAVEIAYGTLSAICWSINRPKISNLNELRGGAVIAIVTKVPRDDRPGQYSNNVVGYKDINGVDPAEKARQGGGGQQNFGNPAQQGNFQQQGGGGNFQQMQGFDPNQQQGGYQQQQGFNPNQQGTPAAGGQQAGYQQQGGQQGGFNPNNGGYDPNAAAGYGGQQGNFQHGGNVGGGQQQGGGFHGGGQHGNVGGQPGFDPNQQQGNFQQGGPAAGGGMPSWAQQQ